MKFAWTIVSTVFALALPASHSFADDCREDAVQLDSTSYLGNATQRISSIYRRCTPLHVSYPEMSQEHCGLGVLSLGSRRALETFIAQTKMESSPGRVLPPGAVRSFADQLGNQTYFVNYDLSAFYGTYVFQGKLQTKTSSTLHDLVKSIGGDLYLRSVSCDELATGRF